LKGKTEAWTGAFDFYTNPPTDLPAGRFVWKNRNDERCRNQLKLFLGKTTAFLAKCQTRVSTQPNESLNSIKAKCAEKGFNWKTTWKARCCVAILDFNGEGWKLHDYEDNGFEPLDYELWEAIHREEHAKLIRDVRRRHEEYEKAERARRWERKLEQSMQTAAATRKKQLGHRDPGPIDLHIRYELDEEDGDDF
jgi:hypothetical protein